MFSVLCLQVISFHISLVVNQLEGSVGGNLLLQDQGNVAQLLHDVTA